MSTLEENLCTEQITPGDVARYEKALATVSGHLERQKANPVVTISTDTSVALTRLHVVANRIEVFEGLQQAMDVFHGDVNITTTEHATRAYLEAENIAFPDLIGFGEERLQYLDIVGEKLLAHLNMMEKDEEHNFSLESLRQEIEAKRTLRNLIKARDYERLQKIIEDETSRLLAGISDAEKTNVPSEDLSFLQQMARLFRRGG